MTVPAPVLHDLDADIVVMIALLIGAAIAAYVGMWR